MINIRRKLFETNSSSVHSFTLVEGKDYDKWCKGGYYLNFETGDVLTREEAIAICKKSYDEYVKKYPNTKWTFPDVDDEEAIEDVLRDDCMYSIDSYDEYTQDYETFDTTFNKGGSEFVVVGYTGWDG